MRLQQILSGTVLTLCALPAWTFPVHVKFTWPYGVPDSAGIWVRATRILGETANAAPVKTNAGLKGTILYLSRGVWQVKAFAAGYWNQGTQVTVSGLAQASAQVMFWPAASLYGEIKTEQNESPPHAVEVLLIANSTSTSQPAPGPTQAVLSCPVKGTRWSCLAPSGVFDVRLQAGGDVPRYEWQVHLRTSEDTDLGQIPLERALSVFGRAVRRNGSAPLGPCRASLQPYAVRGGTNNPPPDEKTFTVPVNPLGYFQFIGVMAGQHIVTVECTSGSGLRVSQVQPDGETLIDPPLELQDLSLDIAITPRTDPRGMPWRLSVYSTSPRLRRIVTAATTSVDGRWMRNGMMSDSYRVAVRDSNGMEWLQKDFNLHPNSGPLVLHLSFVQVAGQISRNGEPVRARLVFSNQNGGEPVNLTTGDDGTFKGRLPIAAGAEETEWVVTAHVTHPKSVQRLAGVNVPTVAPGTRAWLDLELPSIPVRGTVTLANNQPQSRVRVTFRATGSGYQTTTSTDDAGNFEVSYLLPGKYEAIAKSSYGISDPTPFTVTGGSESRLDLILRPYLHVPIHVLSGQKEPIYDAAVQVWVAPGIPKEFGKTDQSGVLTVSLPPGTAQIGLIVGAEDYAMKLSKMPISAPPDANGGRSPSDRNTVTLTPIGGTLILNFEPDDGFLDPSASLYLVYQGAVADARTLSGWGTDQSGTDTLGPAEVDGIAPGKYALCVVMTRSQLAALWRGKVPPTTCSTGTVSQGQTLTLTPHSSELK